MAEKILVISVDRDNDIGEKVNIAGPIIGVKNNLEAASKLLLTDPEDSDANTVFAAVKISKDIKNSEVITLTGDKHVGIDSDQIIASQLNKALKKIPAKKAVLVTDGAEDEFVIPLIQNRLDVISVKRIIIKQSQQLESTYYVITNFIRQVLKDPAMSRTILGIPAIALLLFAFLGSAGWRFVLGAIGLFLLVKGFQIEGFLGTILNEFKTALRKGKISFFLYIISLIFIVIGSVYGYLNARPLESGIWFDVLLSFVYGSIYYFFVAGFLMWVGKVILHYNEKRRVARLFTILALLFSITIVARSATEMLLSPEIGMGGLIFSITLGFIVIIVAVIIERARR